MEAEAEYEFPFRPAPRSIRVGGEGQPRTKVTVSLLPWKRPPLNREPEKRWRKGVPGPPGVRTEKMREIVSTGSRSTSLTASLRALYTLGAEYMAFKEREV